MIEQALEQLQRSQQVVMRPLMRNSAVYYLPLISMHQGSDEQEGPTKVKKMLDLVLGKLH